MTEALFHAPPPVRTAATPQPLTHSPSASVRSPTSGGSGYSNPLFSTGDCLGPEPQASARPAVVGPHRVATPRNPPSPLVAKLRAQSAQPRPETELERRTATPAATPSLPFSSPNPLFPAASPQRTAHTPRTAATAAAAAKAPAAHSPAATPRQQDYDDYDREDSSVDSILLDDGPCPIKAATPGRTPQTFFSAISQGAGPDSPVAPAPAAAGAAAAADDATPAAHGGGRSKAARPEQDSASDAEPAEHAVAPGSIPAPNARAPRDAARPATPSHDITLLATLARDVRAFVGTPGPFLKPVQCYIVREKASAGLMSKAAHVYKLYAESGDTFLLAAQRRPRTKAPSYLVSLDERAVLREGPSYYGKINSNFIGTDFRIYDAGERAPRRAPRAADPVAAAAATSGAPRPASAGDGGAGTRSELAVVQYHMNVMGTKGPRKMTIGVPYVDFDTNERAVWRGESMLPCLRRAGGGGERMLKLVNKVPKWNPSLGAYCLNFNGRVTQASVKNFQLVSEGDDQDRDVLQFGRVAGDRFTMDYCWPLTAFQAFCMCVTSLDSKLACE